MARRFLTRKCVPFADTDMARIVHFTNYLRYLEEAEHQFLESQGLSVVMRDELGLFGFPKLSAHCDYKRPAQYAEWLDITLDIESPDGKTVTYRGKIDRDGVRIAEGTLNVACCRFPADGLPYPIPIPDHMLLVFTG